MRAVWKEWQVVENGPLVPVKGPHPWYTQKRYGWREKRFACLQKFPICQQCERNAAEIVDHIKPFITPEGIVRWALFSDPTNHRSLCRACHSVLTATYDGGFGNKMKAGKEAHCEVTGDPGRQYVASTVAPSKLDAALGGPDDLAALLRDIPA
jgi:5-methylcytosine-specific restriction endonuclease McrA